MVGVVLAFALLTIVTRGTALDRLVTPDEPTWLGWSTNFYRALVTKDFASTYQFIHPGVPVMWLGTLGLLWAYPDYVNDVHSDPESATAPIEQLLSEHGRDPLALLVSA